MRKSLVAALRPVLLPSPHRCFADNPRRRALIGVAAPVKLFHASPKNPLKFFECAPNAAYIESLAAAAAWSTVYTRFISLILFFPLFELIAFGLFNNSANNSFTSI